jgi:hypothetical protein
MSELETPVRPAQPRGRPSSRSVNYLAELFGPYFAYRARLLSLRNVTLPPHVGSGPTFVAHAGEIFISTIQPVSLPRCTERGQLSNAHGSTRPFGDSRRW